MRTNKPSPPFKPTRAQLEAADGQSIADVIGPDLRVLFCGINPGLYSAAIGHHFGKPGNRFWPALHQSGFTPRQYSPFEDQDLLKLGYGITNVVDRASARAEELSKEELLDGAVALRKKVLKYRPHYLAVLGIGAYKTAFQHSKARYGLQPDMIGGTKLWVLPNPSGLNANFQIPDLVRVFRELYEQATA